MITDKIEAQYRHKKFPALCVINPSHVLTQDYKIYLFQKNNVTLLKSFNQWLSEMQKTGQLPVLYTSFQK